jgi:hypothetical protein
MAAGILLPYLRGYPPELLQQVRDLLAAAGWPRPWRSGIPRRTTCRTERALYDYVSALKARHMKSARRWRRWPTTRSCTSCATPWARTAPSPRAGRAAQGQARDPHRRAVQGAPADFLRMIVVHELAHLKEREHDRAFYALCLHMEPHYHQLEFDLRLWLTAREWTQAGPDPQP